MTGRAPPRCPPPPLQLHVLLCRWAGTQGPCAREVGRNPESCPHRAGCPPSWGTVPRVASERPGHERSEPGTSWASAGGQAAGRGPGREGAGGAGSLPSDPCHLKLHLPDFAQGPVSCPSLWHRSPWRGGRLPSHLCGGHCTPVGGRPIPHAQGHPSPRSQQGRTSCALAWGKPRPRGFKDRPRGQHCPRKPLPCTSQMTL